MNTNRFEKHLKIILWAAIIGGALLKLYFAANFTFDKFIDRDLLRGMYPDALFWVEGSELSGGGRTPGGALNIILFLLYKLSFHSIEGVYAWFCLFHFTALFCVYRTARRYFDELTALSCTAFMSLNYIYCEQFIVFWNPTFSFLFFSSAFCLSIKMFMEKKHFLFPWIVGLICIASQMHISNIILLPFVLLWAVSIGHKWPLKTWIYGILTFFLMYSPFFYREWTKQAIFFQAWNIDPMLSPTTYFLAYSKIILNFLGVIFFSETPGLQWSYRTHLENSVFSQYIFIFSALTSVSLILIALCLCKKPKEPSHKILRTAVLLSLLFILPALLMSYSNQELSYRRYLWIGPIFSLACGWGLSFAWRSLSQSKIQFIFLPVLLLYFLTQTIYFYINQSSTVHQESFVFKKEVVNVSRTIFSMNDYAIERQVGLIAKEDYNGVSGQFIVKTSLRDDGTGLKSFMPQTLDIDTLKDQSAYCVLALRDSLDQKSRELVFTKEGLTAFLEKNLSTPLKLDIEKIFYGQYGTYFSYKKIQGNCLQFFTNYYFIPEQMIVDAALDKAPDKTETHLQKGKQHRFIKKIAIDKMDYYVMTDLLIGETTWKGMIYVSAGHFIPYERLPMFLKNNHASQAQIRIKSLNSSANLETKQDLFSIDLDLLPFLSSPLFFEIPAPSKDDYNIRITIPDTNNAEVQLLEMNVNTRQTSPPTAIPRK